jgi:hypothetical protein
MISTEILYSISVHLFIQARPSPSHVPDFLLLSLLIIASPAGRVHLQSGVPAKLTLGRRARNSHPFADLVISLSLHAAQVANYAVTRAGTKPIRKNDGQKKGSLTGRVEKTALSTRSALDESSNS